jgi:hypothetical protein
MKLHSLLFAFLPLAVCARAGTPIGPATTAYYQRLESIIEQCTIPLLARHPDRLREVGTVALTYRVRPNGSVERVKILSGPTRGFVVETYLTCIRTAKFPPIPKAVLRELGTSHADPEASLSFGPPHR